MCGARSFCAPRVPTLARCHSFKRFFAKVQNDRGVKEILRVAQNDDGGKDAQNDAGRIKSA